MNLLKDAENLIARLPHAIRSSTGEAGLICQDDLCLCPKASASRRLAGANDELGTRALHTQACQMWGGSAGGGEIKAQNLLCIWVWIRETLLFLGL